MDKRQLSIAPFCPEWRIADTISLYSRRFLSCNADLFIGISTMVVVIEQVLKRLPSLPGIGIVVPDHEDPGHAMLDQRRNRRGQADHPHLLPDVLRLIRNSIRDQCQSALHRGVVDAIIRRRHQRPLDVALQLPDGKGIRRRLLSHLPPLAQMFDGEVEPISRQPGIVEAPSGPEDWLEGVGLHVLNVFLDVQLEEAGDALPPRGGEYVAIVQRVGRDVFHLRLTLAMTAGDADRRSWSSVVTAGGIRCSREFNDINTTQVEPDPNEEVLRGECRQKQEGPW